MKTGNYKVRNAYDVTIPGRWTIGFYDFEKKQWFQDYDHSVSLSPLEVGPVTFFMFLLTCVEGGYGWGETGQKALMCSEGKTKEEAENNLDIPVSWKHMFLKETTETFYLKHLGKMNELVKLIRLGLKRLGHNITIKEVLFSLKGVIPCDYDVFVQDETIVVSNGERIEEFIFCDGIGWISKPTAGWNESPIREKCEWRRIDRFHLLIYLINSTMWRWEVRDNNKLAQTGIAASKQIAKEKAEQHAG
jgi:hypothetical protein